MSTLLASPYNYDGGDHVWAKVVAVNVYGETDQSEAGNGAYYTREPDSPINVQEDETHRTATQLGIVWSAGASDGGLPVTEYRVK